MFFNKFSPGSLLVAVFLSIDGVVSQNHFALTGKQEATFHPPQKKTRG